MINAKYKEEEMLKVIKKEFEIGRQNRAISTDADFASNFHRESLSMLYRMVLVFVITKVTTIYRGGGCTLYRRLSYPIKFVWGETGLGIKQDTIHY